MTDFLRLLTIGLGLLLLAPAARTADDEDDRGAPPVRQLRLPANAIDDTAVPERGAPLDGESARRVQTARLLMAQQKFEEASAMLEVVYEQHPSHPVVYRMLKDCYENLKFATKELMLIERMEQANPDNYLYSLELASALSRHHKADSALLAYDRALDRVQPTNWSGYRRVVEEMIDHGFEERADEVILAKRAETGDSSLFAIERGNMFEVMRAYDSAAAEYVSVLDDTTNTAATAERQLQSMLTFEESEVMAERLLKAHVDEQPDDRALKLLIDHYLRTDAHELAFELAVTRDSLSNAGGGSLAYIVRASAERELYPQVKEMAEYVLERYPESPARNEVRFLYGDALAELGEYAAAVAAWDTVYTTSPLVQEQTEALYRIARMYQVRRGDCDAALEYYDSLVTHHRGGIAYIRAHVQRPYCHLQRGNLATAEQQWQTALSRPLSDDFKEEIQYNLARIDFYNKQFDSAKTALRKIIVDYPRGFYVNDALYYLRVIDEAEEDQKLLYDYANARLFRERDMFDSTIKVYERLIGAENKALADLALYELIDIELAETDTLNALADINRFSEQFQDSYYLPYVLKLKADILFGDPSTLMDASDIYRQLLKDHPNYPFSGEVRKRLRAANAA